MNSWIKEEVEATVENYFSMLLKELQGDPYNKTAFRKKLVAVLEKRNSSAIELKHQTISAVLLTLGLPYIKGYKPLDNYQIMLLQVIDEFLEKNTGILSTLIGFAKKVPQTPVQRPLFFKNVVVEPPVRLTKMSRKRRLLVQQMMKKYDFISIEALNLPLAESGVKFVVDFEKSRLNHEGAYQLAEQIKTLSKKHGLESPYDIHSFEADGEPRFIKVKTTNCDFKFPFTISLAELGFSNLHPENYFLYRVFDFSQTPRIFILKGHLQDHARLFPVAFQARFV